MAEIHARLPDGTWITGVEVFRRLYGAVGFRYLIPLTRLPGIACSLDFGYRLFAKNRLKWTGRCSSDGSVCQCDVTTQTETCDGIGI
jgi:predicted DCC family thiol-disulfide oxidoreductase YuxK